MRLGFFMFFLFWMFFCEYLEGLSSSFLWLCCKFKVAFVSCTVDILFLRGMRNVTQLFVLLEDGLTNKQLGNLHSYIRYQIRCMALFLSDDFHRI